METASTGRTHDCTRPVCTNLKITLVKMEPSTHDPFRTLVQSRRSSALLRSNVEVVGIMTIAFRFAAPNFDLSQCRDFILAISKTLKF